MLEEPSEGPETFEADEEDEEGGPPANRKALMIAAVAGSAVIVLVLAVAFIFTAGDQAQQGTGGAVAPEPPIALGGQTSEGEQPDLGDGPPHITEGMYAEFTVEE